MPGGGVELLLLAAALNAPLLDASMRLGSGWREALLPKQKPPATRYAPVQLQGRAALQVQVQGSYGNWVHEFKPPVDVRRLRWSWRLEQGNPAADLTRKEADDVPLRVCLSFAMPIERVPFGERQLLRFARMASGEELPAATLCYVWDARLPAGSLVPNAYSARVRQIVLRSGSDALSSWFDESRDVAADFRRAFGSESVELPVASAIIVAGDGDNTHAGSLGYVADLRAEP